VTEQATGDDTVRPDGDDGVRTGQGFDRFVNFSDAVVAIAITLLGLPLVDIPPPSDGKTTLDVLSEHSGELFAFGYTFVVVALLWMAHHRVLTYFRGYDGPLVWLNMLYLLSIVLLPFPSEWVGERGFSDGVGTFYLLTMAAASAGLGLMTRYAIRRPALLQPWARPGGRHPLRVRRSLTFTSFFVAAALLALVVPAWTSWLLTLLIPISIIDRRADARAAAP
jgi:uncharacterized membrane protein